MSDGKEEEPETVVNYEANIIGRRYNNIDQKGDAVVEPFEARCNTPQTGKQFRSCEGITAAADMENGHWQTEIDEIILNSNAFREQEPVKNNKAMDEKTKGMAYLDNMEIKLSKRRWLVLISLALCNSTNAFLWISISSISSIIHKNYNVGYLTIYWSSMIFLVFQALLSIPMSFLVNRIGLKTALVISTAFNALGGALQYVGSYETSPDSFLILFCGRIFPSVAIAIQYPLPPKLSAIWFGAKERATATSVCMLFDNLGIGLGFLVPALLLANAKSNDEVIQGLRTLGLGLSIFLISNFLFTVVFVRDCPSNPPSRSQGRKISQSVMKKVSETEKPPRSKNILKHFVVLVKCKGFLLLSQCCGLYYALLNVMSTVLQQMVTSRFPDKIAEVGWMGCVATLVSVVGILLVGIAIDKTKKYRAISIILWASSLICTLAFTITVTRAPSIIPAFVIYLIWGLTGMSWASTSFEYIADITYPVPEELTTAISLTFGSLYSFIAIYSVGALLISLGPEASGYTITGFYGIGLLSVVIAKPEMKRSQVEKMDSVEQS